MSEKRSSARPNAGASQMTPSASDAIGAHVASHALLRGVACHVGRGSRAVLSGQNAQDRGAQPKRRVTLHALEAGCALSVFSPYHIACATVQSARLGKHRGLRSGESLQTSASVLSAPLPDRQSRRAPPSGTQQGWMRALRGRRWSRIIGQDQDAAKDLRLHYTRAA